MKTYTKDDVERIRRFLVRDLIAMKWDAKSKPSDAMQVSSGTRLQIIEDVVDNINDIFMIYTSESCDW